MTKNGRIQVWKKHGIKVEECWSKVEECGLKVEERGSKMEGVLKWKIKV